MSELPTGTVTFLFTDIEGSTQLLREHADAYAELLTEHRRALRRVFARHSGAEVDTQGDAFFVAFARASDALAAAADAQEALRGGPIRVRIGVHTGEPMLTEGGYVGIDVHRAARIAAAGHGGQVLVSDATARLLEPTNSLLLGDLGKHRLKDMPAPERLFQLGDRRFPPLRTLSNSNLPLPATPLVGRKKELADVLRLLRVERARLVTVTGPGGIGKTRFALEGAHELVEDFAHGVWFVDLSPLRDPELVVSTVATTIGAKGELAEHVDDKPLLLVLDNFEQVVEAASGVAELLRRCPNMQLLVTSREPLHVAGESVYPLKPLAEAPAVALFRERAAAADPDFDASWETLTAIVVRLDRLPLAIELAAARVRAVGADELLSRLDQRLPLLAGRARDVPDRQRTLRATIEWSYDLLTEGEKKLFAGLSVFAGGWRLEAAENVCDAGVDAVESLVDKNLVRRDADRYSMLETVREYGEERLKLLGDARVAREHAEYYAALGERAEPLLDGPERQGWLARLDRDRENARSAIGWALRHDVNTALRLATIAWAFQVTPRERSRWLQRALCEGRGVEADARLVANALEAAGWSAIFAGEFTRAEAALEQAAAAHGVLRDKAGAGRTLIGLARVRATAGSLGEAGPIYDEAIALLEEAHNSAWLRRALLDLGDFLLELRKYDEAEEALERARALAEADGSPSDVANALHGLGDLALERGDTAALASYRRSLGLVRSSPRIATTAYCLAGIAAVTASRGDATNAHVLWSAATTLEDELGFRITPAHRRRYEAHVKAPAECGQSLPLEDVIELALSLD